jgi:hypothetical protein
MKRTVSAFMAASLGIALAVTIASAGTAGASSSYLVPPRDGGGVTLQWYWQIGGGTLPSMTSGTAASANIWDTDLFADANGLGSNEEPDGPSTIVSDLHAAGKYSICYVEAGAYQTGFPDDSHFASGDYTNPSGESTQMQGYANEHWFDLRGFAGWNSGSPSSFTGGSAADQTAAANIAAGLNDRFAGCKAEGQDAVEPDDLDGYTNTSQGGGSGGGWGLTQADSAAFEAWLAYDIHANGLAAFQKNDPANASVDEPLFDGMIIEECNYYNDPCAGSGGDATAYLNAGKPVLNAEYTQDGETTSKFCSADIAAGITGTLFNVNLSGGTDEPCQTGGGYAYTGGTTGGAGGGVTTSTSTSTTTTSSTTTTTPPPPKKHKKGSQTTAKARTAKAKASHSKSRRRKRAHRKHKRERKGKRTRR